MRLVPPTRAVDMPTAFCGETPATYTSTGKVTIAPPPPSKARDNPIKTASTKASVKPNTMNASRRTSYLTSIGKPALFQAVISPAIT